MNRVERQRTQWAFASSIGVIIGFLSVALAVKEVSRGASSFFGFDTWGSIAATVIFAFAVLSLFLSGYDLWKDSMGRKGSKTRR